MLSYNYNSVVDNILKDIKSNDSLMNIDENIIRIYKKWGAIYKLSKILTNINFILIKDANNHDISINGYDMMDMDVMVSVNEDRLLNMDYLMFNERFINMVALFLFHKLKLETAFTLKQFKYWESEKMEEIIMFSILQPVAGLMQYQKTIIPMNKIILSSQVNHLIGW